MRTWPTSWSWEPVRTGSPPPSRAPRPAARCSSSRRADTIGGGTRTRRADAARASTTTCARPSTRWPRCRRSSQAADLERHGLELVHPEVALVHPLDDGRAGRAPPVARRHGRRASAWTARPGTGTSAGPPVAGTSLAPVDARPAAAGAAPPAHDGRVRRCGACLPATWLGAAFRTDEARGLFAGARRPLVPPAVAPVHLGDGPDAPRVGPRGRLAGARAAGRSAIADAMAARLAELGGDDRDRAAGAVARRRPRLAGGALRRHAAAAAAHLRRRAARRVPATPAGGSATGPACSRSTTRCPSRCRGRTRTRGGRGPCTSAARSARSRPPRPTSPPGGTPLDRSCWSAQQSLFDPTRAPAGQHTLWTYCHVPARSTLDMTDAIEARSSGSRRASATSCSPGTSADSSWYEAYNQNLIGGDIAGGSHGGPPARCCVPRPGVPPVRDAEPAAVPVLGVDAARRRRPRHVRPQRRPGRRSQTALRAERRRPS